MKKIKFRKLNMDAILKALLLLGFTTFFFITIKRGTIHMYVHPRIISYIKIGIVIMLAMSLFQLKEIFKPQRKQVNLYPYLFFILPLIMAFSLPAREVNLGTVSFGSRTDNLISSDFPDGNGSKVPMNESRLSDNESYDKSEPYSLQRNALLRDIPDGNGNTLPNDIYTAGNIQNTDNSHNTCNNQNTDNSQNTHDAQSTDCTQINGVSLNVDGEEESKGLKLQDDIAVIDENNFVKWVDEISNNPLKYEGKKVTVSGFVFKDEQFESNEFVAARMMMTCCAADMSIIGLPAQYRLASELKQDSWFEFSGTIVNGEFNGQQMPIINIERAEKISKPQYEYVYPY